MSNLIKSVEKSPYAQNAPSLQQTLDLFAGRWASALPSTIIPKCSAGSAALFEDPRVHWAIAKFLDLGIDIQKSSVLELGPLEGGHTYMLAKAGAKSVTAIEANPEAFIKCLILKELLGIERVNFLFGEANAFLREGSNIYDIAFACGILYHMADPLEFLRALSKRAKAIFLWTVFWDEEFSRKYPHNVIASDTATEVEFGGSYFRLHRHDYGPNVDYSKFWGGGAGYTHWMEGNDILKALNLLGFTRQVVQFEENPNGAALRLVATRPDGDGD